jgi:RNA polymerase sporulation-specific sigma factor
MVAREVTALAPAEQVVRFEPLCKWIVKRYYAPGLDRNDLLQEARIGALKGLRDFRGERGNLDSFVRLAAERQVITAVKTAQRHKHGPLNTAVTVLRDNDDGWVDALDKMPAGAGTDPHARTTTREHLHELATDFRERLSDLECACLVDLLNGESYEEIGARHRLTVKQVDRALTCARWKLSGEGPPSAPERGLVRRDGAPGYTCPSCGGATVKKPGRGRPPRCAVCRAVEARAV